MWMKQGRRWRFSTAGVVRRAEVIGKRAEDLRDKAALALADAGIALDAGGWRQEMEGATMGFPAANMFF